MSSRSVRPATPWRHVPTVLALSGLAVCLASSVAWAGDIFRTRSVGGVAIDAEGVVRQPTDWEQRMHLEQLRQQVRQPGAELMAATPLRKVSLRGLEQALDHALRHEAGRIPDELRYLAGLQRIEYVFLYPEHNDIVLAGPGEGWQVDEQGNVVGVTSGRPVLLLEDLAVALRSVGAARTEGILCSIDPTAEGLQRLNHLLDQVRRAGGNLDIPALEQSMKEAFGPQQVMVRGVPTTSHFARVLVAADYRMKRLGMKLDDSPVRGLPSYLDLIRDGRAAGASQPRWWMTSNYEPLARSDDGLSWQLRGAGVRVLTEDSLLTEQGQLEQTGRANPAAQRWAELFTEHYDELSVREPIFGQLRNLMDLCVLAALLEHHDLWQVAGLSAPLLTGADDRFQLESWPAPTTVAPHCSFLRTRRGWIVTASGGVDIDSWNVVRQHRVASDVHDARQPLERAASSNSWWWN